MELLWRRIGRTGRETAGRGAGIVFRGARDTEVGEDHPTAVAEVHVGRLDVSVDEARLVSRLQHVEKAESNPCHLIDRQRPLGIDRLCQRSPRQHLHDDPRATVLLDNVVDADGSVVVDACGGARFAEHTQTGCLGGLLGHRVAQDDLLERDRPFQQLILGEPNLPHAAATQHRPEPVTAGHEQPGRLDCRPPGRIRRDGRHRYLISRTRTFRGAWTPTWSVQESLHTG